MKKALIIALIVLLLSAVGTGLLWTAKIGYVIDVLPHDPGSTVILQKKAAGTVLDDLRRRVLPLYDLFLLDEKGNILQTYELPKDTRSTFSEYNHLALDDQDQLYVHRTIKDAESYYVIAEEILRFDSTTGMRSVLYQEEYLAGEAVEYPRFDKLLIDGYYLMLYLSDATQPHVREVYRVNLYNESVDLLHRVEVEQSLAVKDLLVLSDESVLLVTEDGKLLRYQEGLVETVEAPALPEALLINRLEPFDTEKVAFFDHLTHTLWRFDPFSLALDEIRTAKDPLAGNGEITLKTINGLHLEPDGEIAGNIRLNHRGERIVFVDGLSRDLVIKDIRYQQTDLWSRIALHGFMAVVAAWLLAYLLGLFRKGGSLLIDVNTILLPLVLLIPVVSLSMSFIYFNALAKGDLRAELFHLARERATLLSVDAVEEVNGLKDYQSASRALLSVQRVIDATPLNDQADQAYERWYYSVVYRMDGEELRVIDGDDMPYWQSTDRIYGEKSGAVYRQSATTSRTLLGENADFSGEWVFALSPLVNEDGQVVGLLEVGTGAESYAYFLQGYFGNLAKANALTVGLMILLMSLAIYRMILPLRRLKESVELIVGGQWGTTVAVKSKNEIGVLSRLFNTMSLFIRDHVTELTALNQIYYRFIPQRFFELINRSSITEVEIGDHSSQQMTLVAIHTENYFEKIRGASSQEQLSLLDEVFQTYSGVIHSKEGLIGEFKNAGITALFADAEMALGAAQTIMQEILRRSDGLITRISIHSGEVLLGIVGDKQRMTTAVISRSVNEVHAMNEIAERYQCGVLLSDAFLKTHRPQEKELRDIGHMDSPSGHEPLRIKEWIASRPVLEQETFQKTASNFEEALKAYEAGQFREAKRLFIRVIKKNPYDEVAKEYLYRCERAETSSDPRTQGLD